MLNEVLPMNRVRKSIVIIVFRGSRVAIYQGSTKYIARKKNLLLHKQAFSVMYECYVNHKSQYTRYFTEAIAGHCVNLNTSKSGPYHIFDPFVLGEIRYMCEKTSHCKHTLVLLFILPEIIIA
ncbi:ORF24 [Betabaculovirus altermyunipunctae]|uniref:ORF24 n=1 Tax=Betabaculovirus altermyunipunctae TaxID=3051996 RepID=A0A1S5YDW5_9BBAC|nr:ORF24 [Betabaculovirus altermyunipunctae]AQQ80291.1 ORF24 [Betabaculovirus altermyunipunctae]